MEKVQQTRYEEAVVKLATSRKFGGYNSNRGYYNDRSSYQGRGNGRGNSFFGRTKYNLSNSYHQNPTKEPSGEPAIKLETTTTLQQLKNSGFKSPCTLITTSSTANCTIPEDGIPPGGRLTYFSDQWKKMTDHQWPLSVIMKGYKIQFHPKLIPWTNRPKTLTQKDQQAVDEAVQKFLNSTVIEESLTQDSSYLSTFFTIVEPNKVRPILDWREINHHIQCHHFKMEGIPALGQSTRTPENTFPFHIRTAYTSTDL